MPSPFPGMNPYLEQEDAWHDFHQRFPHVAGTILNEQLGPNYIVKTDETVFIHELPDEGRRLLGRPDLFLARQPTEKSSGPASATQTLSGPMRVHLPAVDVERHPFLEILDRLTRQVVTVIELLSPTNKAAGADREYYLGKRRQILRSNVHFLEIDLLRGFGERMPQLDLPSDAAYGVLLSRIELRPEAEVWPIRLRDSLPDIPVPLRAPDADIVLPLQQVLHRLYDETGYAKYIYAGQPQPALSPADAAWAQSLIPS